MAAISNMMEPPQPRLRRPAIEPAIGHLKSDHRMDRCWLQGALGDTLHSISCAAGYNLRWLLRAIARLGIGAAFLRLLWAALPAPQTTGRSYGTHGPAWIVRVRDWLDGKTTGRKPIFGHAVWVAQNAK